MSDCWAGDVRIGLCLRDVAVLLTNVKLFNANPPNDNTPFSYPCAKPITFHHLLVQQVKELYELEIAMKKNYKEVLMEHLLSLWISPDPKPNTLRNGDEYQAIITRNLESCTKICKNDKKCVSYFFNHITKECTKQSKVNVLKSNLGTTTGLAPKHFKCKSSKESLIAKKAMVGL
jgi:hypothetical protein